VKFENNFFQKTGIYAIVVFRSPLADKASPMTEEPNIPSQGAKRRAAAKVRREARAQMRQVVFEGMASGFSIEEIAEMRKVSPRTIRREVDRTLSERRLNAPERYVHFQVARLNKALRVADAGLDRGELRAIGPMMKVVKELDRYHGLRAPLRPAAIAPPDIATRLPRPPLRLAPAAAPFARRPSKNGGPEAAATTLHAPRPDLDARIRGTDTERLVSREAGAANSSLCATARAAGESDFVTDLVAQALEIMGRLPKLQPASDGGEPPERGAASAPSACHPRASGGREAAAATLQTERLNLDARVREHDTVDCAAEASTGANASAAEGDFVTGFEAQGLEIMGSLPKRQAAADASGEPREVGAASTLSACHPRASGGLEAAAATPQTERLTLDARVRRHDTADCDADAPLHATAGESDFVTGFAGQPLEITRCLPELQPGSEERGEGREVCVGPAHQRADALALPGPIGAAEEGGQGRGAARFGDHRDMAPKPALRLYDRWVADQHGLAYEAFGDGEVEIANPLGPERIGRDRVDLDVDRRSGL
jgi:hypothetical protein